MLSKLPEVGQTVIAKQSDNYDDARDDETNYQTKGCQYKIEGISTLSRNPYFTDDNGDRCHIDGGVLDLYELLEDDEEIEGNDAHISLIGLEVDTDAVTETTAFIFRLNAYGDSKKHSWRLPTYRKILQSC